MIVHRLLDAFFRTLDTIDAIRDRVDQAMGKEPRPDPWAVEWPPPGEGGPFDDEPAAEKAPEAKEAPEKEKEAPAKKEAEPAQKKIEAKKKAPAKKKATSKSTGEAKKPGRKKKASAKRKGSVDRSGKDLDSPRARAIHGRLKEEGLGAITEDAELDGKKVLARVVWALNAADLAGAEKGLTTNDVSALLSAASGIEVFATNIGRACRDHKDLITESEPDGRSKRYVLTAAGKKAAASLETTRVKA